MSPPFSLSAERTHDLALATCAFVDQRLHEQSFMLREGNIIDATIIHAPSLTENKWYAGA
jgi:hypothetical protein